MLCALGASRVIGDVLHGIGRFYPGLFSAMVIVFVSDKILESFPKAIILGPIEASVEVDPVHFAVVSIVGAPIGFITWPYGLNLYVAYGVTGVPYFRLLRHSTL